MWNIGDARVFRQISKHSCIFVCIGCCLFVLGRGLRTDPEATLSSDVSGRDNEGVVYADGRLYVSAEADQSIREYDLDGRETGRTFQVFPRQ